MRLLISLTTKELKNKVSYLKHFYLLPIYLFIQIVRIFRGLKYNSRELFEEQKFKIEDFSYAFQGLFENFSRTFREFFNDFWRTLRGQKFKNRGLF